MVPTGTSAPNAMPSTRSLILLKIPLALVLRPTQADKRKAGRRMWMTRMGMLII